MGDKKALCIVCHTRQRQVEEVGDMPEDRDWDPGKPAAFSFLYTNATDPSDPGKPKRHVTWLQTMRIPLIALALGVFLAFVGPVPGLGALIIICSTFAAAIAAIMKLVGG